MTKDVSDTVPNLTQSEPVLSIEVDWADEDNLMPEFTSGVLVTQIGTANGNPVLRVSATLPQLIHWVATQYYSLQPGVARSLAETFEGARFVKVNEAFAHIAE
jgi:hypothetical protein